MMKNLILTLTLLFTTLIILTAQSNRYEVTIHISDKKTESAMMTFNENAPWSMQKSIEVYHPALKNEKRIKRKQKTTHKAKSIKGFEVNGRIFESKKVMIPAGNYGNDLTSLPNFAFVEVIEKGKISVYKAYSYPPKVASGITFSEIYADIRQNPNFFVIKEGAKKAKLKDMNSINIEKWVSDAPGVSEKLTNGDYGNFKRKEGKKVMNFIKSQIENENPQLIVNIIRDYNKEKEEE